MYWVSELVRSPYKRVETSGDVLNHGRLNPIVFQINTLKFISF